MSSIQRTEILAVPGHSAFCRAALASGLLSQEQLDKARAAARGEQTASGERQSPATDDQPPDEQIAARAVELGFLNVWQVEQLKLGRTKFTLGQYRILDSLGRGGMGHVFKAEHAMLGRLEAIKVLPAAKTTDDAIANFRREIRAQAQLDHPNLVRLIYAGRDGPTYFFVTEFVPGADLRRLVRRNGRLSMREAATIIAQAARGLQYAHERGLIHRDIKPGNLLVTPEGHTKVADLGLADYLRDDARDDDPRAGKIVGTADYLAPEAIRSPGEASPAGDVYALGCTLYYAVTGKVPFPGGSTREKLRRHCDEMPLHPRRLGGELDDDFLEVLADMMAKDAAARIATAAEVIRRLAPWALSAVPMIVHEGPVPPGASSGSQTTSLLAETPAVIERPVEPPPFDPRLAPPPADSIEIAIDEEPSRAAPRWDDAPPREPWRTRLARRLGRWAAAARRAGDYRPPPGALGRMLVPLLLTVAILLTLGVLLAILAGG